MTRLLRLVPALLVGALMTSPAAAQDTPDAGPASAMPTAWLSGPWGRVPAGTPAAPAAADPDGRPLDAYVRRAPLVLEVPGDPDAAARLTARAVPEDGGPTIDLPVDRAGYLAGPDRPGTYVIEAGSGTAKQVGIGAWLVTVPDREPPADGLLDLPVPDTHLDGDAGQVTGVLGDACFVYLCVEVGRPPRLELLPTLPVSVGETLAASLADGSAIVAWEGSLQPLGTTGSRRLAAAGVLTDTPTADTILAGLEPDAPGAWRLDLRLTLDRDRGWLETSYRLVAGRSPDQAPADSGTTSGAAGNREVCASSGSITPRTSWSASTWAHVCQLSK